MLFIICPDSVNKIDHSQYEINWISFYFIGIVSFFCFCFCYTSTVKSRIFSLNNHINMIIFAKKNRLKVFFMFLLCWSHLLWKIKKNKPTDNSVADTLQLSPLLSKPTGGRCKQVVSGSCHCHLTSNIQSRKSTVAQWVMLDLFHV